MTRLRVFGSRVLALFGRQRRDAALTEEIQAHLDLLAQEFRRSGTSDKDAWAAARREFGGVEQTKELYRDQRGVPLIEAVGQDVRCAFRQVRRSPAFALTAIVILALGTGANTAIFSVLKVALQGLSFRDADRLQMIWTTPPNHPDVNDGVSVPEYLAWKQQNHAFDEMGAMIPWSGNLGSTTNGVPAERLIGQRFTASLFELLGVRPELGRWFTEEEDAVGAPADVAVISHRLWQSHFAGDPSVINTTVLLDGTATKVVGVMPADFHFFDEECDYWIPFAPTPFQVKGSLRAFLTVGRLKPHISIQQAQTEMDGIAAGLARTYPNLNKGRGIHVQSLDDAFFHNVRQLLLVLQVAVGFILLIACANIAGLLLVRGASRQREVALRYALGACRARILSQFVTESALLSAAGGTLGMLLAWGCLQLLATSRPTWLSQLHNIAIDAQVLAFTTVVAIVTTLGFGGVPALQVSRVDPIASLKDSNRGATGGRGRRRMQSGLVVAQLALTLVLLIGAGLVMKSFARLQSKNLGFDPKGLLSFESRLPANQYFKPVGFYNGFSLLDVSPVPAMLFDRVVQRLQQVPGVRSAAGINQPPLNGSAMQVTFTIEGRPAANSAGGSDTDALNVNFHFVTPNFFTTMRMPLMQGRDFSARDTVNAPWVAIINQAMARRYWPHEDPLGQRLALNIVPEEQPREIVGLVGDVPLSRWDVTPSPMVYVPQLQLPQQYRVPYGQNRVTMTFVLRIDQSAEALIPEVRRSVADVNASLPVAQLQMVEQYLGRQVEAPRYVMLLLGIFGVIAMMLAMFGIYGVVAYSVAQRAREIGIRIALGASGRSIVILVVRQAVLMIALGLALGFAGSLIVTSSLTAVLWEITATDPATFIGGALLLAVVALVASLIPTARALRMNPRAVLCDE